MGEKPSIWTLRRIKRVFRRLLRAAKDNFKRWWQVKMWTQFFDDMLNPKTEDRQYLPNLLQWRKRLLNLFEENEELRTGLTRARETIDMKYMEKWRRSSL